MYLLAKNIPNRILLASTYKIQASRGVNLKKRSHELTFTQKPSIINSNNLDACHCIQFRFFTVSSHCLFTSVAQTKYQKLDASKKNSSSSIIESKSANDQVSTHVSGAKKVKQAASDASYTAIIIVGGVALLAMFYYLFSELFSRETPTGIYEESSKFCTRNTEVIDALGVPIKVTAESGGRRVFQIRQKLFMEEGVLCLIINYYLEGPRNKGNVMVKVKKNETTGKYEYDYIVVKLDQPHRGQYKINVKPEL